MSTDPTGPRGLADLSQRELRDLLHALRAGWLDTPPSELALRQAGVESAHVPLAHRVLSTCHREAAQSLVGAVLAEREHRPPPHLELVWTGPETPTSLARDTGVLVRQLFERAEREVIIGGFRFDHGESLFRPLHDGMQRGLSVTMFVDIDGHASSVEGGHAYAKNAVATLLDENWPFGPPYPTVYYDPRSAVPGPPWVSLHAKCIVVDARWALVTSANFTARGQTRNIEVGVCIEDLAFAGQLAAHWKCLVLSDQVALAR